MHLIEFHFGVEKLYYIDNHPPAWIVKKKTILYWKGAQLWQTIISLLLTYKEGMVARILVITLLVYF